YSHQALVLQLELLPSLDHSGIHHDAVDGAHFYTLRYGEVADALRAARGLDAIDLLALRNRLVRAFGLADVAVDALVGDQQSHSKVAVPDGASSARRAGGRCASRRLG